MEIGRADKTRGVRQSEIENRVDQQKQAGKGK